MNSETFSKALSNICGLVTSVLASVLDTTTLSCITNST